MSYEPVFVLCPRCNRSHLGRKIDSPVVGVYNGSIVQPATTNGNFLCLIK
jgi:hypothetical protein